MRNAIDMAKLKNNKSEFYYKLTNLNEKIRLFRSIYYSKMPNYHLKFLEKKKKALKEKLAKEKEQMKKEYEELNQKLAKLKMKKTHKISRSSSRKSNVAG